MSSLRTIRRKRRGAIWFAGTFVLLGLLASPVFADPPRARPVPQRPADRHVPDYDGLPEPGDDVGDVFLWTARVLTSPLYLLSEYVIRRPLGWALTEIERNHIIEWLRDMATFGPNDNIAVLLTLFYEFDFQPAVGLYSSWDEFLFPENRISTHGAFGGTDWLSWTIADRIMLDDLWTFTGRFLARRRPDFVFGGIGPNATALPRARFGADRIETIFTSQLRYWQKSDLDFEVRYRSISFTDVGWNDEPSVGERAQEFGTPVPFGFDTGYEAISGEAHLDLDTRTPGRPPEGGFQVAAHAGAHTAFAGLPELARWVSWGGATTAATDVLGYHRVIGLTAEAHFITPLGDTDVPFTELIDVGGAHGLLPGYYPGQIQGFSAAGLTAHYTWPIWAFLDARLYLGTANAFGRQLEDFDAELLRLSFGMAFAPRVEGSDLPFELDFAFATDTFERGAEVDSFRFAIGARDAL